MNISWSLDWTSSIYLVPSMDVFRCWRASLNELLGQILCFKIEKSKYLKIREEKWLTVEHHWLHLKKRFSFWWIVEMYLVKSSFCFIVLRRELETVQYATIICYDGSYLDEVFSPVWTHKWIANLLLSDMSVQNATIKENLRMSIIKLKDDWKDWGF